MWCAIYLSLLVVCGYAIAAGLAREASRLEVAALTLCMGPAVMGFCLILLSMLGIRPAKAEILAIAAIAAAAGVVALRFRRVEPTIKSRSDPIPAWWILICAIAIGYGLISVANDALMYPVNEWDAFAIWQLKAKVLAIYPLCPRPAYFTNLSLSYSHLRYPLLVPMMSAGMHALTGPLDDLGKTISLLLYPGMGLAVFAAVRRINGITAALTATALLACLQPFCRYGGSGTAEMAITVFYACSLLCILRWRENGNRGLLVLAAIFSGWMAWTKNEGLALAAINAIVVAASGPRERRRKSLAAAATLAAIAAAIYLPWILYSWGLPRTDEDYAGRFASLQIFSNFGRLGTILVGFGKELIDWEDWGLFWVIAAGLALAERGRFRNPQVAVIGVLLVLHLAAYVPAFLVTNWRLEELLSVTLDRLLMHAAPAGAILIGALWPAWAGGKQNPREPYC
jgi:4-amino-4-deoxy-L-arabinose transferase-like glycosyltransferase